MATTLCTGSYHIRCKASAACEYIGRELAEDKSYGPKKIVSLPANVPPQTWNIEALPNGAYKLTRGALTGIENGHVLAFLLNGAALATEWTITRIPQGGDHTYTIVGTNLYWALDSAAPHSQISTLNIRSRVPGTYPATELWEITPA